MKDGLPDPIRRYIDAYNDKDVAAMLACLAQDIRFTNLSAGDVSAQASGIGEFRDLANAALAYFSSRHQDVTNSITVADTTLAEIAYSATVAEDLPNGWQAGQEIALTGASLFEVKDGKISRIVDQS